MTRLKIIFATTMYIIAMPFACLTWFFNKIAEGFIEIGQLTDDTKPIRFTKP